MSIFISDAGAYEELTALYVGIGGSWVEVTDLWVGIGGSWVKVWPGVTSTYKAWDEALAPTKTLTLGADLGTLAKTAALAESWDVTKQSRANDRAWSDTLAPVKDLSHSAVGTFQLDKTAALAESWDVTKQARGHTKTWANTLAPSKGLTHTQSEAFSLDKASALGEVWGRTAQDRSNDRGYSDALAPSKTLAHSVLDYTTPQNFSATRISDTEVDLTWDVGFRTGTALEIERYDGGWSSVIHSPPAGTEAWNDTSSTATTTQYRIRFQGETEWATTIVMY